MRAIRNETLTTSLFLSKWLTIAYLFESMMLTYVPADMIANALGANSVWAIPTTVIFGVPVYLNVYAALTLVDGLISMDVNQGAGMAFLISGGVTSISAVIAVFPIVKRPLFILYIGLALVVGTLVGLGYQVFFV